MGNRGLVLHCWKPFRRDYRAGIGGLLSRRLSRWIVASVLVSLLLFGPAAQKAGTSASPAGAMRAKPALCVGTHSKECGAAVAASSKKATKSCAVKARKHTKKCLTQARNKTKKKSRSTAGANTKSTSALPDGYGPAQFRGRLHFERARIRGLRAERRSRRDRGRAFTRGLAERSAAGVELHRMSGLVASEGAR